MTMTAKRVLLLVLTLSFLVGACAGCKKKDAGDDEVEKKVIKKTITVEDESETESVIDDEDEEEYEASGGETQSQDFYDDEDDDEDDENPAQKVRRALAEKQGAAASSYIPEYTVKSDAWSGPAGYVIVVAANNSNSMSAAKKVQAYFKEQNGTALSIVTDKTAAAAKEILVGNSDRYKTKLAENEFAVKLQNDKLIFEGGHFAMVEGAANWFSALKYTKGKVNSLSGAVKDFVATKDKYKYVWGDEFAGGKLDMIKWDFKDRMAGTASQICLRDENVVNVNEGMLKLSAIRYYDYNNPAAQYATNSSVCTQDTMSYMYGYLEIRARVPYRRGAWPSFWLLSSDALNNHIKTHAYNIEIDVFEVFSSTSTAIPNIHKWRLNRTGDDDHHTMYNGHHYLGLRSAQYRFFDTDTLSEEYHIYGFKWTPTEMVMSVDGQDYATFDLTVDFDQRDGMEGFQVPMFIIFNNFIYTEDLGQTNSGNLVNNSDLPFEYYIDWVRLYQRAGEGDLNFPE